MGRTRILTYDETRAARKMLTNGVSMDRVQAELGGKYTSTEITAAINVLRARSARVRQVDYLGQGWRKIAAVNHAKVIPPNVIEDRDRRLSIAPADITALICGDPIPGYSAADRPRAVSSLAPHPVDLLLSPRMKSGARYG